ncbi:hypothetical protein, partial [Pararhodobacter sp.]|uniref:hypothetical protein n=1 Tax=Pararhodobacter sp. TaxID=2127056 RepID=UPI002FDD8BF4
MKAILRNLTAPVLCALALMLTAAPAAANRAWAQTETLMLDRPGHDGRMVGQLLTCDEVRISDSSRTWVLVHGRRGQGWVQRGALTSLQPAQCRYGYSPP